MVDLLILRRLAAVLALLFCSSLQAGGNAKLMENARQKAFLLNKRVIGQLERLQSDQTVSLTARVVHNADGSLRIAIDEIQQKSRSASPKSPDTLPVNRDKDDYIIYMPFEEMLKNQKGIKSSAAESSAPSVLGGAAADR